MQDAAAADALIVGSSVKVNGLWSNRRDAGRARQIDRGFASFRNPQQICSSTLGVIQRRTRSSGSFRDALRASVRPERAVVLPLDTINSR
jgi:hypothetical protein